MYHNSLSSEYHELAKIAHVSRLLPYSGLFLTVICIAIFLMKQYVLEPLVKRFYGDRFFRLDETQRNSFLNHWVAGGCKLVLLVLSAYPAMAVVSGKASLESPWAGSKTVKLGDTLIFTVQLFSAMYIFELFFRKKVSYISAAHHIGAIVIAQSSTVLFLDPAHAGDAPLEFILCMLWGGFDVVAEFWPHIAVILYRTYPDRHRMLARIFFATTVLEVLGTTVETITIFSIFFSVWSHWTIEFKILSPTLHLLFSLAQLFGAKVFWGMAMSQWKKAKGLESPEPEPESDVEIIQEHVFVGEDNKEDKSMAADSDAGQMV